jgi:hypothetical protein
MLYDDSSNKELELIIHQEVENAVEAEIKCSRRGSIALVKVSSIRASGCCTTTWQVTVLVISRVIQKQESMTNIARRNEEGVHIGNTRL